MPEEQLPLSQQATLSQTLADMIDDETEPVSVTSPLSHHNISADNLASDTEAVLFYEPVNMKYLKGYYVTKLVLSVFYH